MIELKFVDETSLFIGAKIVWLQPIVPIKLGEALGLLCGCGMDCGVEFQSYYFFNGFQVDRRPV